jgi:hypothetical protein
VSQVLANLVAKVDPFSILGSAMMRGAFGVLDSNASIARAALNGTLEGVAGAVRARSCRVALSR